MKLAGGSPALAGELNVDAFLRQVFPSPSILTPRGIIVCSATPTLRSNLVGRGSSAAMIPCTQGGRASLGRSTLAPRIAPAAKQGGLMHVSAGCWCEGPAPTRRRGRMTTCRRRAPWRSGCATHRPRRCPTLCRCCVRARSRPSRRCLPHCSAARSLTYTSHAQSMQLMPSACSAGFSDS